MGNVRQDPSHPRVVIAGGSGFLGTSLSAALASRGVGISVLSRGLARGQGQHPVPGVELVEWDARSRGPWERCLDGADALINLVGRSVDCPKTASNRDEIMRSRVESTLALGHGVRACDRPPPVWVQMSTAHIYGDPPEIVCDESTLPGVGFAPEVGLAWEGAFAEAAPPYLRRVVLRTSFVLGTDRGRGAGALGRLARLARLGLGGTVGAGRQGVSWIHEADMNAIFEAAAFGGEMRGTYVATAPNPVSNKVFMKELRRALRVPFGLPSPDFMVRIGARVMKSDPELAMFGRFCVPKRLEAEGFGFRFATLGPALADLFTGSAGAGKGNSPHAGKAHFPLLSRGSG